MRCMKILRRSITGCIGLWLLMLTIIYIYLMNGPGQWGKEKSHDLPHHLATMPEEVNFGEQLEKREGQKIIPVIPVPDLVQSSRRIAEYCNHPSDGVYGDEGNVRNGYKLLSAHVVIRHGDRTSMNGFPKQSKPYIPCTIDKRAFSFHPKLRAFVPTMTAYATKQNPRSDFKTWALFPDRKQCRSAELTGMGVLQHVLLGDHLNKKYIHKWQLFDGKFSADKLHIRATGFSRTYQSAIAFLYGFLPYFNLTELLIKQSESLLFCDSLYSGGDCKCPVLQTFKQKVAKLNSQRKNSTLYKELTQHIAKVYDIKKSQLPWQSAMMDVFMGQACHGISQTCNKDGDCITQETVERLWSNLDLKLSDPQHLEERMSRLSLQPLFTEISQRMENISKGVKVPRFVLYSGHDITIIPVAEALGIYNGRWPPYATRIVIEQYAKTRDGVVKHFIKVLYNGVNVTSKVRFCKERTKDGLCRLESFFDFVNKNNLGELDMKSYREGCQNKFETV